MNLTARQREILRLVASGEHDRAIGAKLNIAPKTVERHLSLAYVQLGVHTRAAAVASAIRKGML